jgi:hypothetical protein
MTGVPKVGEDSVDEPVLAGLPRGLAVTFGAVGGVDDELGALPTEMARGSPDGDGADRFAANAAASSFGGRTAAPDSGGGRDGAVAVAEAAVATVAVAWLEQVVVGCGARAAAPGCGGARGAVGAGAEEADATVAVALLEAAVVGAAAASCSATQPFTSS